MSEMKSGRPRKTMASTGPVFPDQARVIADAIDRLGETIREAFGPQKELRIVPDEFPALAEMHKRLDEAADPASLVVEMTPEEARSPHEVRRATEEQHADKLRRVAIRSMVLQLCGWEDGAEVTADGSYGNDLATERADAVMAFLELAKEHSLPRKLLPRGDRLGDWLPPGTPVVVHLGGFEHPAVVEPSRDLVTVRLTKAGVVSDYPRDLISKEGEPWTPPKRTSS